MHADIPRSGTFIHAPQTIVSPNGTPHHPLLRIIGFQPRQRTDHLIIHHGLHAQTLKKAHLEKTVETTIRKRCLLFCRGRVDIEELSRAGDHDVGSGGCWWGKSGIRSAKEESKPSNV